jgi:hypothetical protein
MRMPLVVAVLLVSAPSWRRKPPEEADPVGRKVRFNGRLLGAPSSPPSSSWSVAGRGSRTASTGTTRGTGAADVGRADAGLPPSGLALGGPLPADASGGGRGRSPASSSTGASCIRRRDGAPAARRSGLPAAGGWTHRETTARGRPTARKPHDAGAALAAEGLERRTAGLEQALRGDHPGQNMNLASDGTTTCFSVAGDTRCTGM